MKVYELLSDESKWTKGARARNRYGGELDFGEKGAKCWCLSGAICTCYPSLSKRKIILNKVYEVLYSSGKIMSITMFNDDPNTTFENVRSLCLQLDI